MKRTVTLLVRKIMIMMTIDNGYLKDNDNDNNANLESNNTVNDISDDNNGNDEI